MLTFNDLSISKKSVLSILRYICGKKTKDVFDWVENRVVKKWRKENKPNEVTMIACLEFISSRCNQNRSIYHYGKELSGKMKRESYITLRLLHIC